MITLTHEVDIKRPVNTVFSFLADVGRHPEWQQRVRGVNGADAIPLKKGDVYQFPVQLLGKPMNLSAVVKEVTRDKRIMAETVKSPVDISVSVNFSETSGGTILRTKTDFKVSRVNPLAVVIRKKADPKMTQDLMKLKNIIEQL